MRTHALSIRVYGLMQFFAAGRPGTTQARRLYPVPRNVRVAGNTAGSIIVLGTGLIVFLLAHQSLPNGSDMTVLAELPRQFDLEMTAP